MLTTKISIFCLLVTLVFLADSFRSYTLLNENRTRYWYIKDYPPEVVEKYLCEQHHMSRENALYVINRVGTRLGLVDTFANKANLEESIDLYYSETRRSIIEIAKNKECLSILKALGDGMTVSRLYVSDDVKNLKGFSNVFFMDHDNLNFQNEVVRNIWMSEFHDPGKILSLPI